MNILIINAAANKFNVKKEKKPRKKPQPEAAAGENAEATPEQTQTDNA